MSVLGDIVSGIFRRSASPASATPTGGSSPQPKPTTGTSAPSAAQASPVDVSAVMDKLAAQSKEKLDWHKSIVDLMKLLDLDSSLAARKRLAQELHYSGHSSRRTPVQRQVLEAHQTQWATSCRPSSAVQRPYGRIFSRKLGEPTNHRRWSRRFSHNELYKGPLLPDSIRAAPRTAFRNASS